MEVKAVLLAGGRATRMGATARKPKPLLDVGDRPMIAHVMDLYVAAGVNDFVVCAGHRFHDFVHWFERVAVQQSSEHPDTLNFSIATEAGRFDVTLVNTGEDTNSGGRLRRVAPLLDTTFFLTYADGLSDVNISSLLEQHRRSVAAVTLTAFPLAVRYGVVDVEDGGLIARAFQEKPVVEQKWCNGGFYVVEPSVVHANCTHDDVAWEADVLTKIAAEGALGVHRHDGFWASMDFAHEHDELQKIWETQGPVWLTTRR